MSKLYKNLTDEELRQEIERLEGLMSTVPNNFVAQLGVQETLERYRKELDLREKLPV